MPKTTEQALNESYAYKEGCVAATNKKKVGDNPHNEHTNEHWAWMSGYTDTIPLLKKTSEN